MTTRKHINRIELAAGADVVFKSLCTPSAVCKWWSASRAVIMPQTGGVWAAAWGEEDDPDYIAAATISVFEAPRKLVLHDYKYYAKTGALPFEANFVTEFSIEPFENGCALTVAQDGFPAASEADEFYAACEAGWEATLASLKNFVESAR